MIRWNRIQPSIPPATHHSNRSSCWLSPPKHGWKPWQLNHYPFHLQYFSHLSLSSWKIRENNGKRVKIRIELVVANRFELSEELWERRRREGNEWIEFHFESWKRLMEFFITRSRSLTVNFLTGSRNSERFPLTTGEVSFLQGCSLNKQGWKLIRSNYRPANDQLSASGIDPDNAARRLW